MPHEAVFAYFTGSQCGFEFHNCHLRRYPDYKHTLCPLCRDINSRWPPPPKDPPKPEKDPNLIYPGDIDPDFKPSRGDILVVNPSIGTSLRKLGFKGCCVVTYDGSPDFPFVRGDVIARIGDYEVQVVEPPPKAPEKKGKGQKPQAKAPPEKQPGAKAGAAKGPGGAKGAAVIEAEKAPESDKPLDLVTYKPYEKVEVYYCSGDGEWRFMGLQGTLETKQKVLLETQCPGLTVFYRYYKTGTKVLPHTLTPCLGEIILPQWLWQEDFDHKANKWRAAGKWYRPDIPEKTKLLPGMILLRPLVGQLKAEGSSLLNVVEMGRVKRLEEAKAKELADKQLLEKFLAMEKENAAAAAATAIPNQEKGKKNNNDPKKAKEEKKDNKIDDKKQAGKKADSKDAKNKGTNSKGEKDPPPEKVENPPEMPPNNNEFLKLAKWGAVEMYLFEGEGEGQGWTYYGRSNRICDTAYAVPPVTEPNTRKPKFVHEDDWMQIVEPLEEEKPPEPEPDDKSKKSNKGEKKEMHNKMLGDAFAAVNTFGPAFDDADPTNLSQIITVLIHKADKFVTSAIDEILVPVGKVLHSFIELQGQNPVLKVVTLSKRSIFIAELEVPITPQVSFTLRLDYEGLQLRCRLCQSVTHSALDCPSLRPPPLRDTARRNVRHISAEPNVRHNSTEPKQFDLNTRPIHSRQEKNRDSTSKRKRPARSDSSSSIGSSIQRYESLRQSPPRHRDNHSNSISSFEENPSNSLHRRSKDSQHHARNSSETPSEYRTIPSGSGQGILPLQGLPFSQGIALRNEDAPATFNRVYSAYVPPPIAARLEKTPNFQGLPEPSRTSYSSADTNSDRRDFSHHKRTGRPDKAHVWKQT
ncbi:hypothetical protein R1sor_003625 [Riccia sorocarpa]|uniref:DUF4283 domain-containing protein n=1 Tax=Riccia sorocarpa TaxID=122646 RepID=A0ABD3H2H2_9MARC